MVMEQKKIDDSFQLDDLKEPRAFDDGEDGDDPIIRQEAIVTANNFFEKYDGIAFRDLPMARQAVRINESMTDPALHNQRKRDLIDHIDNYYYR